MIKIHTIDDWKKTEETPLSTRFLLDFPYAKVQVFEFKKGYEIPPHTHKGEAIHIITKGKIQLSSGDIIEARGDYHCGGWEYTGVILQDAQIIVIESANPAA